MWKRTWIIQVVENGEAIPVKASFDSLEKAIEAAKKRVDDALPNNIVRVLEICGYAGLAGDGDVYWKPVG